MQSPARRETSHSNGSVHISREVSVTSSRVPTPSRNASYSTMPSTKNGHFRGKGGSNDASVAATTNQLNRWNSKTSDKSSVYYERSSIQRQHIPEHGQLENHRESMKALSDFLMTREPPSSNWMLASSSEDEKSHHAFKRSAFKIFGRQKKKEPKQPRLIQLPDSAVAARTRRGARHIAISIPLEHDPVQKQPVRGPVPTRHSFQSKRPISERGAVTVLKPVAEVRESASSQLTSAKTKDDVQQPDSEVPDVTSTPPPPPPPEAGPVSAGALESYYTHINRRKYSAEGSSTRLDPNRSQRSYITVFPVQMARQESLQSDPRLSGGKLYSTASIVTAQIGHSRGASSVSAAPSVTEISSVKLDLPTRASSIAASSQSAQTSTQIVPQTPLAQSSSTSHENVRGHARVDSNVSALSGVESMATTTSSPSPPPVFGMAETARKYSGQGIGGPQIMRSTTPRSSMYGALTKSLPELPGSQAEVIIRPQTTPPVQSQNSVVLRVRDIGARSPVSQRETKEETVVAAQSRQERVKARKQRDIQDLRSKSVSSTTNSKQTPFASQEPIPRDSEQTQITPPRTVRCRRSSQERARRQILNTISPIMLVANLPTFPIQTFANKRSSLAVLKRHASSSRSRGAHTPPRSDDSYTSDSNSDLDTIPSPPVSPSRRTRPSSQSLRSTLLSTRRQERRAKRNMSLREKELDDRLSKIEYDNTMLLHTLSGIARSFGELSRMEKRKRFGTGAVGEGRWDAGMGMGLTDEEKRLGELERMEPVMRDLAYLAPRVSEESVKRGFGDGEGYDEFAEDDGISILG